MAPRRAAPITALRNAGSLYQSPRAYGRAGRSAKTGVLTWVLFRPQNRMVLTARGRIYQHSRMHACMRCAAVLKRGDALLTILIYLDLQSAFSLEQRLHPNDQHQLERQRDTRRH